MAYTLGVGGTFCGQALNKNGAFVQNVSKGIYQATWNGAIPANSTVAPGYVTYLGIWVRRFDPDRMALAAVKAEIIDELPIAECE